MLTMQDALLALTRYWTEHGCMTVQPMNTEVGAGTLNPATALRVLGPEPWRVAYVEPSVRPDDSRYGDNPNRLQTHTQFQVVMKPEPGDPQELYLGSLKALGIDIAAHDVRFVEDNWASPALGAWGLGWEVWLDGLEITQFTYFQQSGGIVLDPVSVEITYGIERIIMALQQVNHFKDITYAPGISYGEAFGQAEYEMSRYYLDEADVTAHRGMFEVYATQAARLVEARLPIPAHTYVLKCSQTFNVLDSRGAISTTERAQAFARMRKLAHSVAELWVQRRAELGYPLGTPAPPAATPAPQLDTLTAPESARTLAFEIGVEELPATEVTRAADAVHTALAGKLASTRLVHGTITVHAAPRRILALVDDIAPRETDDEQTVRGPRLSAAYDADGKATTAARGFARGQGIDVSQLQRLSVSGGDYVGYVKHVTGRTAGQVLAEVLPEVITELRADKNMRWRVPGLSYSRPIRWIAALLGDQVLPFTVAGMTAGRTTWVQRTATEPHVTISTADQYAGTLRAHHVEPDAAVRRDQIITQASTLAAQVGGHIDFEAESALTDEVTNLVEHPVAILGSFDGKYLELPAAILTTVMKTHQRYFPVHDHTAQLMPIFVAVANGACDHDTVRTGNEAVLSARYEDATFFYRNDLKIPLAEMKERLNRITFETRLGSLAERAQRIHATATGLADRIQLTGQDRATVCRAGELAKFDLGSELVVELSSLAGTMATEYARHAGEPAAVADALYAMELPRHGGDELPATIPGALLALADRFDLLAGLFAIGSEPTGSSDPFGLRRAALGVLNILLGPPQLAGLTIRGSLQLAASQQPVPTSDDLADRVLDFIARRFEQLMLEAGHAAASIRAVAPLIDSPARAHRTLEQLAELLPTNQFTEVHTAIQRVRRIVPEQAEKHFDPDLFESPAEQVLAQALHDTSTALGDDIDLQRFITESGRLVGPIGAFFGDVLVMADDPAIRRNRLGLLASIYELAANRLDWRELA
jgi:glycyl-tRNA synthetase